MRKRNRQVELQSYGSVTDMQVVVTYLKQFVYYKHVSFPKLNNFTLGLVVDTLQPYFLNRVVNANK